MKHHPTEEALVSTQFYKHKTPKVTSILKNKTVAKIMFYPTELAQMMD